MDNKKDIVKEEELENVSGGAAAGMSAGMSAGASASAFNFVEPTKPYSAPNSEVLANNNVWQIPVNPEVPGSPNSPIINK